MGMTSTGTESPFGIKTDPANATDQRFKLDYARYTIFAYTLTVFASSRITLNFQLVLGILFTYQFWNLFWIKLLLFSPNMYKIKQTTGIVEDWIQVSITHGPLQLKKDRIVSSISELSGIRGTHMMVALRIMTALINMLLLVAIHMDLDYRKAHLCVLSCTTQADYVPLFMYIFCVGNFLAGHFELNMTDSVHTKMHYLGVLGIFVGSLMIGFVSNWSTLSIVLLGLEYGSCAVWFYICANVSHKSKDLAEVTRNSKKCVGFELLVFQFTNFILLATIHACGPNEGNILSSPFK